MALSRTVRRYRGWIAASALLAICAVAFAVLRLDRPDETRVTYETTNAAKGTLSLTVAGTGNLVIDDAVEAWPKSAGVVASVAVTEGTSVTTGTTLYTLDAASASASTARALASYRQAQQQVVQAEGQLAKARNDLADVRERYAEQTALSSATTRPVGEVTLADIASAEAAVDSAEAGLTSAKASRTSAKLTYDQAEAAEDDLTVESPASGIVWSVDVAKGDNVSTGGGGSSATADTGSGSSASPPVVIAPDGPLTVRLTVNEVDVPALEVGQRADVEFDALPDFAATGKVSEIAKEGAVSQGVVTFSVWLTLDVANDALKPGMSAAATIVTEVARDALLVPNAAVKSTTDGSSYVEVLDEGADEPRRVTVGVGLASPTQTQIVSGLSEGDAVVTVTTDGSDSGSGAPGGGFMLPGMGGGPRG